jgi:hypothetical protein
MSDFKYPLEMKSLADYHPSEVISTGYEIVDLTFLNMMAQSSHAYGLSGAYLPSYALGQSASSSLSTTDEDILITIFRRLLGESWKYIISIITSASWPTLADYDFIEWAVKNYRAGLRLQPILALQEDTTTAATTVDHLVKSLNWDDDATAEDNHTELFKRIFFCFGIRDAGRFPELTDSVKDASTQVSWNRVSEIMCLGAIMELSYLFPLGAAQSDRFVWAIGASTPGLLPRKVSTQDLAVAIDPIWLKISKNYIHDALGDNLDDPEEYDGLAHAYGPFDFSLVDLSAMDPYNQRLSEEYDVPVASLEMARRLFGGARKEIKERGNYETINYALLLNLAEPASSGYTAHGISEWAVGPNTAIAIDFLEDLRRLRSDFEQMLSRQHWTWFDVKQVFTDFWTNFDIVNSLSGFCDPNTYKGVLRQFGAFQDSSRTFPDSDGLGYYSGGNYTSTEQDQAANSVWQVATNYENWFHTLLVWKDQDPRDCLYMGTDWDINELLYDLILQLLFHSDTNGDEHKVYWFRQRYVEMIDFRDGSHFCFAGPTTTNDIKRAEILSDYLETDLLALKYGVWMDSINPTFSRVYIDSRPKGYVEHHPMRIERYGDPQVKIQLIQAAMALWGKSTVTSNSPVEVKDSKEDKEKVNPESKPKPPPDTKSSDSDPVPIKSKPPDGTKPPSKGGADEDE